MFGSPSTAVQSYTPVSAFCSAFLQKKQGEADICEEIGDIKAAFECGVPMEEVRTLLEVQKLFLEIQKLKVELGLSNKVIL